MRNVQRTSYARRIKALSDERARLQRELREAREKMSEYWAEREMIRKERDMWRKVAYSNHAMAAQHLDEWVAAVGTQEQWVDGREDGARIAREVDKHLQT